MFEDFLFEEVLEGILGDNVDFILFLDNLNSIFIVLVDFGHVLQGEFHKFTILELDVVGGILFEGDLFRSNIDSISSNTN